MTATVQPGVYEVPEDVYHADKGSLSVSGAKRLLPPSCPARFKWDLDNGQKHKAVFDFGTAAHSAVLGTGAPTVIVDAEDWRGKAAREARDAAYAAGSVPLLAADADRVEGMAAALRKHPIASALLDPTKGKAEQSLYLADEKTGVMLRGRLDWLPNPSDDRMVVGDYKTTADANPDAISKAMANFGYALQDAWYSDLVTGLGLAEDVTFLFIFQERTAPYLITVCELDGQARDYGRQLNRKAIDTYAACVEANHWPDYAGNEIPLISLPAWAMRQAA